MNMTKALQDTIDRAKRGQASMDDVIDELTKSLNAQGYKISRDAVREGILGNRSKREQIQANREKRRQRSEARAQTRKKAKDEAAKQLGLPGMKPIVKDELARRGRLPGGSRRDAGPDMTDPVNKTMGDILSWAFVKFPKAMAMGTKEFGEFIYDQIKTVPAEEYYPGAKTFGAQRTYEGLEAAGKQEYRNFKHLFGKERQKAVRRMLEARRLHGEDSTEFDRASKRIVMLDRIYHMKYGGPGLVQLIIDDFLTRYGSVDKFLDTLENRPDQIITDLAAVPWLRGTRLGKIFQRADPENILETIGMARRHLLTPEDSIMGAGTARSAGQVDEFMSGVDTVYGGFTSVQDRLHYYASHRDDIDLGRLRDVVNEGNAANWDDVDLLKVLSDPYLDNAKLDRYLEGIRSGEWEMLLDEVDAGYVNVRKLLRDRREVMGEEADVRYITSLLERLRPNEFADGLVGQFAQEAMSYGISEDALLTILQVETLSADMLRSHLNSLLQTGYLDPAFIPAEVPLSQLVGTPETLGGAVDVLQHYGRGINPDMLAEYEDLARTHIGAGHSTQAEHISFLMDPNLSQPQLSGAIRQLENAGTWTASGNVRAAVDYFREIRSDVDSDLLSYFTTLVGEHGIPESSVLRFLLDPDMTSEKLNDAMHSMANGEGLPSIDYRGRDVSMAHNYMVSEVVLRLNPNVSGEVLDTFLNSIPSSVDGGDVLEVLADPNLTDSLLQYHIFSMEDFGGLDDMMVPWASSDVPDYAEPPPNVNTSPPPGSGSDDLSKVQGESGIELTDKEKMELDDFLEEVTAMIGENQGLKESPMTEGGEMWNLFQNWKKERYKGRKIGEDTDDGPARFPEPTTEKIAMAENQYDTQISDDFYTNSSIRPSQRVEKVFDEETIRTAIKMIEYNRQRVSEGAGDLQGPNATSEYRFEAYEKDEVGYGEFMGYYTLYVHGNQLRMRRIGGYGGN